MSKLEEYASKSVEYVRKKQKEVFRLAEIATLQRDMRSSYCEIGKLYYENRNKSMDPHKYDVCIQRLQSLEKEILSIRRKMEEGKGSE
ncbi:MAG: hypothetical protein IJP28_00535 [Erysipelotrichales bacterium]|nr:hypothetical protein [Erysipelotrichales bacterium]